MNGSPAYDFHAGIATAIATLRAHAEDRERQASVLDERKGLPLTLSMAEVVRLKKDETLACVALLEKLR